MSIERNLVMVRLADPKTEPVREWLEANSGRNGFDPAIMEYPGLKVLAAQKDGEVLAYMPVQPVAVLESIGINPEANARDIATAVMELTKHAAFMAYGGDCREMFFLGSDPNTSEGAKNLGFEDLTEKFGYHVFRARLK